MSPNGSNRTPEDYPYSHDEYYLWRTFERNDPTVQTAYTDRMCQWDDAKYSKATNNRMKNWNSVPVSHEAAQLVVRDYFGPEYECVGVIQSMNVGNGYPVGVICYKKKI